MHYPSDESWHPSPLQALLDEWRAELARKPLGMTESDALQVLGIQAKEDEQV